MDYIIIENNLRKEVLENRNKILIQSASKENINTNDSIDLQEKEKEQKQTETEKEQKQQQKNQTEKEQKEKEQQEQLLFPFLSKELKLKTSENSSRLSNSIVMESGQYNLSSLPQHRTALTSIPFIERGMKHLQPFLQEYCEKNGMLSILGIGDFGCSQGANSLPIVNCIVKILRKWNISNSCLVYHCDLPSNDFESLFHTVETHINSYKFTDIGKTYPVAIGKSFYDQCLPDNALIFAFASTSLHWLSKIPCALSQGLIVHSNKTTAEEMKCWKKQAQTDWLCILKHRNRELQTGGIFIINNAARLSDSSFFCSCSSSSSNFTPLLETNITNNENRILSMNTIADYMFEVAKEVLSESEISKFCLPLYRRTLEEHVDPITLEDSGFEVLFSELEIIKNVFFEQYQEHRNRDRFIKDYINYIRMINANILFSSLDVDRTNKEQTVDKFFSILHQHILKAIEQHNYNSKNISTTVSYTNLITPITLTPLTPLTTPTVEEIIIESLAPSKVKVFLGLRKIREI